MVEPDLRIVTEGDTDLPIARALATAAGFAVDVEIPCGGKTKLDPLLEKYSKAAVHLPWLVIRDLDHDATCAAALVQRLLPHPAHLLSLRIAVRSMEAWLLADLDGMAGFLRVSKGKFPLHPEQLASPKDELVRLARLSPKKGLRDEMVPRPGTSRRVGPGYESRVIEFATNQYRLKRALPRSPSLRGALASLQRLRARCDALPDE